MKKKNGPRAWVVAADMGYGHERAAWPLRGLSLNKRVLCASDYPGIPLSDKLLWEEIRGFYEAVSRFKRIPVLGDFVFSLFDKFQAIREFYPREQGIEGPTLQLRQIYGLMERSQWGKHLIEILNKNPVPLLTTFSTVAFMAERWKYKGSIYLVVTDSDIARSWVSLNPKKNTIRYLVPTDRARARLVSYGVLPSQIILTGFPLPQELLGKNFQIAKKDLARRIANMDPKRIYQKRYRSLLVRYLGKGWEKRKKGPIRITFAIGGAGAQAEIASQVVKSTEDLRQKGVLRLCISVGIRKELGKDFKRKGVSVHSAPTKEAYFASFNKLMRTTDILWTKPSELVFYAGLGIPLIIAPPIGSQEAQNRKWILSIGAGISQLNPAYTHEWLPDFLASGQLAEAAMQGFVEIEKEGVKRIRDRVLT